MYGFCLTYILHFFQLETLCSVWKNLLKLYLQVKRVRTVINEGVREIWLSSEDTGAYGTLHYFHLRLLFNFIGYDKLIVSITHQRVNNTCLIFID